MMKITSAKVKERIELLCPHFKVVIISGVFHIRDIETREFIHYGTAQECNSFIKGYLYSKPIDYNKIKEVYKEIINEILDSSSKKQD